jgi:hypothetical protein
MAIALRIASTAASMRTEWCEDSFTIRSDLAAIARLLAFSESTGANDTTPP